MEIDLSQDAPRVAQQLIGWELIAGDCGGIIIETEAYTADDPASHSYRGRSMRNAAMFMQPGTIYMYKIYGMHTCLNIVCGNGDGQAVLIRALRPTRGITKMQRRRGKSEAKELCSGPAKLVQALKIPFSLNGVLVQNSSLRLLPSAKKLTVRTSARIGITKAADVPWRFFTS